MSQFNSLKLTVCAALCFLGINSASAALYDRGGGLIYDSDLNITWLQDFNYAKTSGYDADGIMSWDEAKAWADVLTVRGYDDWRLPTFDNTNPRPPVLTSSNEFGSLWMQLGGGGTIGSTTDISPFTNLPLQTDPFAEWYWTGQEGSYYGDTSRAWRISMNCACWDSPLKSMEYHVTAVRTGDVSVIPPVPEPETYAMLLVGLGLIWFSTRRKRNINASTACGV